MPSQYVVVIVVTTIGFAALAAALLIPVYRFMKREEAMLEEVTDEELHAEARRRDRLQEDQPGPAA